MLHFTCLICSGKAFAPKLLQCADLTLRTSCVVDYGACIKCALVQQVPLPASTAEFYPSSYPTHPLRGPLVTFARKLLIRGCYFEPTPKDADKVLLDFGCGDGSYLESVKYKVGRRIGFEAAHGQARQVRAQLGIDVSSDHRDIATVPDASVDILTAHFVVNHLTDLDGAFAFWRRALKPGGRLHLAVPNINSFEARLFGKKWHGLDSPRHISFPSGRHLASLAKSHGFKMVRRCWGVSPNTWTASLATVVAGHYSSKLFVLMMPVGVLLSWLMPQSTAVYTLVRQDSIGHDAAHRRRAHGPHGHALQGSQRGRVLPPE